MNALIQSVKNVSRKKDTLVKQSITTQLSNSVKEIQLYNVDESVSVDTIQMKEALTNLCSIIEAMFLHGLKDSLAYRARRAIADIDKRPDPSFWAPLLVISHRQIINQITKLSQITTEIGQCRAWIRLALNDCLLSSYIATTRQDSSVLKPYYNTEAYVRDLDLLEVAQKLIEGVETFSSFSLASNSSLLNTWQIDSLVLAGIWSPTLRACPVATAVDVAQSIPGFEEQHSDTVSLSSAMSFTSRSSGLASYLTEDEILKIILAKHEAKENHNSEALVVQPAREEPKPEPPPLVEVLQSQPRDPALESNLGNSLNTRIGWSFSEAPEDKQNVPSSSSSEIPIPSVASSKLIDHSYNALIESYNLLGGAYIKTPDLKDVWQNLEKKPEIAELKLQEQKDEIEPIILVKDENAEISLEACIGKIANERGLSRQNYNCAGCKEPLALTPKPKVCGFTAEYFCSTCMSSELTPLPAKIIHNWDFKEYSVSQKSLNYINQVKLCPTVDIRIVNPLLYTMSSEVSNLQLLRIRLNFLRDYLYTCREPVIEQLQQQMEGKDYLYEHVHQYSISDLFDLHNGVLQQLLEKVVKFGKDHVQSCWLCSQKGFICELCKKLKILYPFDIENVYRCNICNAVFHSGCFNANKPCPKCKRRKEREDLSLLGATME